MAFAAGSWAPLAIVGCLGLVLGSTQSLCRSLFARFFRSDRAGEYYGFHALAGRASSELGPLLFGLVALAGSQRAAMGDAGALPRRRRLAAADGPPGSGFPGGRPRAKPSAIGFLTLAPSPIGTARSIRASLRGQRGPAQIDAVCRGLIYSIWRL
ncbi:MFS transporter [Accumulibacter sp.]|uniref:MFS transporter n=1 Tax=Accumulibacter sp. TaxID=2053492 RepID=UPI00342598F8